MELPKHIINAINSNKTSIGDNPAMPPEDEHKFLLKCVHKEFDELTQGIDDIDDIKSELSALLVECKQNESSVMPALEQLCLSTVNRLMPIPEDTLNIDASIVDKIDTSGQRLIPEDTSDFSFDSIDEINGLSDEIYKRRLLNALINGASMHYAQDIELYLSELYKINPKLPYIYDRILKYNNILLYTEKDTLDTDGSTDAGNVDVFIPSGNGTVSIKAQAIIFPILLSETIKGLFELAISHGLPNNIEKADYILKKADFKLADNWDYRIGMALWRVIADRLNSIDADMEHIGTNFLLMQISELPVKSFNRFMQEVLLGTRKGNELLKDMCDKILYLKEKDEFSSYMSDMNDNNYQINDSDCFTADELISDSVDIT